MYDKNNITITFNVALYLKAAGDRVMAERLHQGIVEKFPGYMGILHMPWSDVPGKEDMNEKAVEFFTKAVDSYEEATVNKAVNTLANIRLKRAILMEQETYKYFNKSQAKETYMLNYRWQTLNFKLRWIMRGESRKII